MNKLIVIHIQESEFNVSTYYRTNINPASAEYTKTAILFAEQTIQLSMSRHEKYKAV